MVLGRAKYGGITAPVQQAIYVRAETLKGSIEDIFSVHHPLIDSPYGSGLGGLDKALFAPDATYILLLRSPEEIAEPIPYFWKASSDWQTSVNAVVSGYIPVAPNRFVSYSPIDARSGVVNRGDAARVREALKRLGHGVSNPQGKRDSVPPQQPSPTRR
ncbi:MAG: hypothetical protein AB1646_26605 [Thermodesulfobacteriota bacterium]